MTDISIISVLQSRLFIKPAIVKTVLELLKPEYCAEGYMIQFKVLIKTFIL